MTGMGIGVSCEHWLKLKQLKDESLAGEPGGAPGPHPLPSPALFVESQCS